jgi:hypothetical protein
MMRTKEGSGSSQFEGPQRDWEPRRWLTISNMPHVHHLTGAHSIYIKGCYHGTNRRLLRTVNRMGGTDLHTVPQKAESATFPYRVKKLPRQAPLPASWRKEKEEKPSLVVPPTASPS